MFQSRVFVWIDGSGYSGKCPCASYRRHSWGRCYVTPGVLIEVVDESDNPLPLGKEGLLRIRSPHNIKGYFGNPEETKNAFRDGCFYPGDLGYLTRDGMLVVSGGRHKTRLNLGGAENSAVHTLLERD